MHSLEYTSLVIRLCNRGWYAWNILPDALLQVEREVWIREHIGIPTAGPGRAGDVDPSIDIMEPDFDAAGLACFPADGRNVYQGIC